MSTCDACGHDRDVHTRTGCTTCPCERRAHHIDAEPRDRWGWVEPGPPAPKDEPLRPWLRHDTEWSSEQDFRGEFGQQTAFGEGIE